MAWVPVLASSELAAGEVRPVDVGAVALALWRTRSGELVACDARCPHQWSHLGFEGAVDGEELVCTAHFWRFDASGASWKVAMSGRRDPKAPVEVHPVRERDGVIEVDLPGR